MPQDTMERPKGAKGKTPLRHDSKNVPWDDIRDCVAAGVSMLKVSKRFAEYHPGGWEPLYEIIRKRASRHNWLVPATAMKEAQARLTSRGVQTIEPEADIQKAEKPTVPIGNRALSQPPRDAGKVGTILVENASELAQSGSLMGLQLIHGLLERAAGAPERLAPLIDVQDIASAVKTARLAGQLDKQGPTIALNLWSDSPMSRPVTGTAQNVPEVEAWSDDE